MRQGGEVAHHAAEAVVERHRYADAIVGVYSSSLADEEPVVQDVVVGQRRPFRRPGGAGRVLDVRRVVELQLRLTCAQIRSRKRVGLSTKSVQEIPPGAAIAAEIDHMPQRRDLRGLERAAAAAWSVPASALVSIST